ncbi:DENN domain-containing protein 1A [Exaiptasia diaphana]|uniref:UDENN domain-containing protein n=1 Tax=Exaiptasia diaphana TaxID=2652724 RepID=A0A913Y7K8_EXADI|nr:DENN domain-containing protein 1A [Exaiptasia diaphana]
MFVPIVPPHLLDYCCAPMPFLAGVHSSLMPSVRKMPLDEVVILNADTNEVECPFKDAALLPLGVISDLKSTLKKLDLPIHDRVSKAFLSAMVSLVGSYRDALRFKTGEKIVFDKDVFVESKSQDKRQFLQSVLHLQLFEQFISERLELLNSGQGFNDLFEEQIGLQAEDQKKLKHQYKMWMRGAKKIAKEGGHEIKQNLKEFGKEAKKNLNQMKGNIEEMLKGKDDEEIGGEIKKSNSLPYMKHYGIGARISPINRRRALSPQPQARKAHSFHQDGDRKVRPQRPPPPKKNVRDRTNAMSLLIDGDSTGKQLYSRHSTPNLSVEPPVATLVSLDEDHKADDASSDSNKHNTLLDLAEALSDEHIDQVISTKDKEVSKQPSPLPDRPPRRSSQPNRPAIPPRPSVKKKSSSSSVSSALNSPGSPSECLLTPLKPIPIDLQKDIIDSLGPDCQMFFPEWQSRISKINSEITSSASGSKNTEHSPTLIDGLTMTGQSAANSAMLHEDLSNSLQLVNKPKNSSTNQTQVSLIDTGSSTSEDCNFNSTSSPQPSHWVNFE